MWQVQVMGQAPQGTNLLGIEDQVNATPAQQKPVQQQPVQQQPMQQQPVQQIGYQQMQQMVQQNGQQTQQGSMFAPKVEVYSEDIPF